MLDQFQPRFNKTELDKKRMIGAMDVHQILQQMSVDEKISLLAAKDMWHTAALPQFSLPAVRVSDGPNGVRGTKFFDATASAAFPNGTALGSTFDKELLFEAGQLMANEAYAKSVQVILGPTVNIQRSPLGGRAFESFSEDPHLSGICAANLINGIQSEGIAATIKHFVCNDQENERMLSNSMVTKRALREIYLEPFRLALKYSDPKAIMTSYNRVNGEHVSHSKELLLGILREEWGYEGTIMSDWFGTYSTKKSLENGLDIEFPGPSKWRKPEMIEHLLGIGELANEDLDARALNVLRLMVYVKEKCKKFVERGEETTSNDTPETASFLRKASSGSIVLLKNADNLLPFSKTDSIAVIGPSAKMKTYSGGGSASLRPYYVVTPYQGISNKLSYVPTYASGCSSYKSLPGLIENLVTADGDRGVIMEFYKSSFDDRSPSRDEQPFDRKVIDYSYLFLYGYENPQTEAIEPLYYAKLEGFLEVEEDGLYEFGLAVFGSGQLFVDDKLVIDNKTKQTRGDSFFSEGTVEEKVSLSLKRGQTYKITLEYGSGATSLLTTHFVAGGIQLGFRKVVDEEEELATAINAAKSHDKVVLCVGLNGEWESEGYDRTDYALPGMSNRLVSEILKANPNTVVVNQSGTPVEMPWMHEAKAIIQTWYGGNELGNAIADVIFGDTNPSGKLPLSWTFGIEETPSFLNSTTEMGRVLYGEDIFVGYRYYEKKKVPVAFPFGHGLSYTTFDFDKDSLLVDISKSQKQILVKIDVTNSGVRNGATVVQVYVKQCDPSVPRPLKELKGFQKVFLKSKERKTISIAMDLKESLSYFNEMQNKWNCDAGTYEIIVGSSSEDVQASTAISLDDNYSWSGL